MGPFFSDLWLNLEGIFHSTKTIGLSQRPSLTETMGLVRAILVHKYIFILLKFIFFQSIFFLTSLIYYRLDYTWSNKSKVSLKKKKSQKLVHLLSHHNKIGYLVCKSSCPCHICVCLYFFFTFSDFYFFLIY